MITYVRLQVVLFVFCPISVRVDFVAVVFYSFVSSARAPLVLETDSTNNTRIIFIRPKRLRLFLSKDRHAKSEKYYTDKCNYKCI